MNRRVLIVDDEAALRSAVHQLLASRFEVFQAASAAEALAACEEHGPFAAIVSDHGMRGTSGIELCVRLAEEWPATARILLTGCADLGVALEALERGSIFRFLTKPPDAARLLEAVGAAVERYHAGEQERQLTEQLAFARESLQALNGVLEQRLQTEIERLDALARESELIASADSAGAVLARTTEAVREILGAHETEVRVGEGDQGIEIVPRSALPPSARRSLAILACTARGALASSGRRAQARATQHAALRALEAMARHRDDETGEHLARVSAYSRLLGERLRARGKYLDELTDDYIENLATAAPLHDIGKVSIPDGILFKPGKLDEHEWAIMRTHAAVGAEILRGVRRSIPTSAEGLLDVAQEIAWTHHERWDGTGYPRGLAREEIPLAGRVVALCDCYDALTSDRPYKLAWPHHAAATYLTEQRGLAFDPAVVDAFLAHEGEFEGVLSGGGAELRSAPTD